MLNLEQIRRDFPNLHQEVHGKPLVYLDNGATAQKPQVVIDALERYYSSENSNVHRGIHYLSAKATELYEAVRKQVQDFIHAEKEHEVLFTKGTTDGINLVANGFSRAILQPGDEVIISGMEHHSNIVPWHMATEHAGARTRAIPVLEDGSLDQEAYKALFSDKTKLVAVVHVSNTLGTVNPIRQMVEIAHAHGVPVLVDGAQAVPHMAVDVQALDVDFYTFSSHKIFGPTGVGILYGKEAWLNKLPPYQGGGDMIDRVTLEKTTYNELPHKFEAGTPNIAGVIAFGKALEYISEVGYDAIGAHEQSLLDYATEKLRQFPNLRIIGEANQKASVISFVVDGIHPSDLGTLLDMEGVAVRTGHHCTQPLMDRFKIPATVRASMALYNTKAEIDIFVKALEKAIKMFG